MAFSWGWLLVIVGLLQMGDGIQEYVRRRHGRGRAGAVTPVSSFLLGLGFAFMGILNILADRGRAPSWLYVVPVVFTGAALVRLLTEQRASSMPPQTTTANTALTPWERSWKVVSIVMLIAIVVASLIQVGTWAGARTAVALAVVFIAVWTYLGYDKKKHGRPRGGGAKAV